jgi:hypothetical protein
MQLLAWAPHAAPLPRRSEVETFWNSFSRDRSIAVLQSVPAFLLQTPGGDPAAPAQVARRRTLPYRVWNRDRSLIDRSRFLDERRYILTLR